MTAEAMQRSLFAGIPPLTNDAVVRFGAFASQCRVRSPF